MPLVKNTITGNNYLEKINTDGDTCSRTAIRSYNKQLGSQGTSGRTRFTLPFSYEPGTHTLWVFVNGYKAVVELAPYNNRQYKEISNRIVQFGTSVAETDVLEFIVAGSYLGEDTGISGGGGLTWILTSDNNLNVQNNYGYMADTRTTPLTFILPADPVEGDTFAVVDAFGTFGTRNVTLNRNGKNILGLAQNYIFDKDGMAAQFVYDGIDNWILSFISGGNVKSIVAGNNITVDDTDPENPIISAISSVFPWRLVSANTQATVNDKIFANTSSASLTITAPLSPVQNQEFTVSDYSGTFGINNCIINRNGSNINGISQDLALNVSNTTIKFVYFDTIQGWKIVSISS